MFPQRGILFPADNMEYLMKPTLNHTADRVKLIWELADFVLAVFGFYAIKHNDFTRPCHSYTISAHRKKAQVWKWCKWRIPQERAKNLRPKWADEHEAFCAFLKAPYAWIWDSKSSLLHSLKQRFILTLAFREWMKAILLMKTVHYSRLSGGHAASLAWWKDATLANNEVGFFFRLCCRHSIMHCLFNRGLCEASALMQHIHPPLKGMQSFLCVCFFPFLFIIIRHGEFRLLSLMWRQSSVDFSLLSRAFSQLSLASFSITSTPGSSFQIDSPQHWKFISGYAEGRDTLRKHAGLEKKPTALSQHLLKESAVVLCDPFLLMLYIDTLVCLLADEDKVNCP